MAAYSGDDTVEMLDQVERVDKVLETLGVPSEETDDLKEYWKQKEDVDRLLDLMQFDTPEGGVQEGIRRKLGSLHSVVL